MYNPKPINPSLLRLNVAAKMVLDAINAGHLVATEGREAIATDSADALQRAHDQAIESYPSQASPFLLYRNEIFGFTPKAEQLRNLVMHLVNDGNLINLRCLIEVADPHYLSIAIELIESFANNGARDTHFVALAREIGDFDISYEEIAA